MASLPSCCSAGPVPAPCGRSRNAPGARLIPTNLAEEFHKYFYVVRAATPQLIDENFRIRHAIYCAELGFEEVRPDARECDEFDARAEHILIASADTGNYVGCARVVFPCDTEIALPVERSGAWKASRPLFDDAGHAQFAELSRLGVVREFRRRRGEHEVPVTVAESDFGTRTRPRFPYIPVGLYLSALAIANDRKVSALVVLTESRLANHFGRLGVDLEQVGEAVDFHRMRAPYMMRIDHVVAGLSPATRALYDVIRNSIALR